MAAAQIPDLTTILSALISASIVSAFVFYEIDIRSRRPNESSFTVGQRKFSGACLNRELFKNSAN